MADTGYKYYKQQTGGDEYYEALPNAGNTPTGYTEVSQQDFSNAESSLRAANPSRWNSYFDDMRTKMPNAFVPGGKSGLEMVNNIPTPTSSIAQDKANASNPNLQATKVGTGTAYIPTGSAGAQNLANVNRPADSPLNKFNTGTGQLNDKYNAALTNLNASGKSAPDTNGAGSAGVQGATPPPPPPGPNTALINSSITDHAGIQDLLTQVKDYFSPVNQSTTLTEEYQNLVKSSGLEGINTQLINAKNIIDGTEDDIRNEITKAGGFATDSQVQAMAAARNKTLIKNYNNLLDQKNLITDNINTMIGLETKDREAARNQLNDQLDLTTKLYDMQTKMQDHARDGFQKIVDNGIKNGSNGYSDLYTATGGDPYYTSLVENSLGLAPGSLQTLATTPQQLSAKDSADLALTNANIAHVKAETAKTYADMQASTPGTPQYNKNQDKLEQQYRSILTKELSNRSGGLGLQDAKVNQAIHLKALANQYKDANGNYNVPKAQYAELVMGLANLLSPTGATSEGDRARLMSDTAKGDIKGALQYITGTPQTGNTQAIIKNLVDSIDRQGSTAEDLRNQAVGFLQGLAPTGLDQNRKDALEKNTLSSYKTFGQPQSHPTGTTTQVNGHTYKSDGSQWVLVK